jgi:hypothetical protein
MNPTPAPFYLDWTFWTAVAAGLALVLSQLPPVHVLFRRTRLSMQPYDRLNITHWLGNPNANLHVQLLNTGGRAVRVRSLVLELSPDDGATFSLPAQTYARADGTPGTSFLFTPFTLERDKEWASFVHFFTPFNLNEERISKRLTKELRADIAAKFQNQPQEARDRKELVEADAAHVEPLQEFYTNKKKWRPGEYTGVLKLNCEPAQASQNRRFRFTLFEADIQELDERPSSRYKFGAGVYFNDPDQTEVYPRIKDLD